MTGTRSGSVGRRPVSWQCRESLLHSPNLTPSVLDRAGAAYRRIRKRGGSIDFWRGQGHLTCARWRYRRSALAFDYAAHDWLGSGLKTTHTRDEPSRSSRRVLTSEYSGYFARARRLPPYHRPNAHFFQKATRPRTRRTGAQICRLPSGRRTAADSRPRSHDFA